MRTLQPAAAAVLAGPVVPMALLVDLAFDPPVRLTTASTTLQVGSVLYHAAGTLGAVETISDEVRGTAGLRLTLSGVTIEGISLALQEQARGVAATVALAVLDPDTHAIVDTPTVWTGYIDQMPIKVQGAGESAISVVLLHHGELLRRPKPLRYTDADQRSINPVDTSLRFIVSQSQHQDVWPAASYYRR